MINHNRNVPQRANVIYTYDRLNQFVGKFGSHYHFLLIVGPPGVGKSQTVERCLDEKVVIIRNHATPLGLYCKLYENIDKPLLIDDVDNLYVHPGAVRLLKALGQTDHSKTLNWESDAARLDRDGIPRSFVTHSPVIMIANSWRSLNENVNAVESRAKSLVFNPTPIEVHRYVGTWFDDPEVYEFFESILSMVTNPDGREYLHAKNDKLAEFPDWRELAMERMGIDHSTRTYIAVEQDATLITTHQKMERFISLGGGARASYYRLKKALGRTTLPISHRSNPSFQGERNIRLTSEPVNATLMNNYV